MAPPAGAVEVATGSKIDGLALKDAGIQKDLYLFVNGKEYKLKPMQDFQPDQTLLTWLRSVGLTGTKLGCGEGGCGACTVSSSHYDPASQKVVHRAVNACITPVCAMEGCHVVTVEGIGNSKIGLHPVQKRLSDKHGSQCGFCTPGFVMSMYSLLRNNPTPNEHEVEHCIDGNLCRCTGYRPILEAFKTFCPGESEEKSAKSNGCCNGTSPAPYNPSSEMEFPPQLLPSKYSSRDLQFQGSRCTWYRPTSMSSLLALKAQHPAAKIVVGNSELEIERKFRSSNWEVLVCTTHVPEMNELRNLSNGVHIGSAVTLSRIYDHLNQLLASKEEHSTYNFKAMLQQLRWFAGTPIRNVAAIGGNICNASPISDLNPVLMACGAVLTLIKVDGSTREISAKEFFKERMYRQTHLGPDELLLSVFVPETKPMEFSQGYKVSRRRDDDIAIVTAGLRVRLEQKPEGFVVVDCGLAYGGMAASSVNAKKTEEFLKGKTMSHELIRQALEVLPDDLPLADNAPGGMIEFRKTLSASFLFKFGIFVLQQIAPAAVDPAEQSAGIPYSRPVSSGLQHYTETGHKIIMDPAGQAMTGPFDVEGGVGKAVKHLAGDLHVTGEAVYVDDMPNPPGGLYGGLVLSQKSRARLVSVDPSPALALAGVHGYFDHKDVEGNNVFGAVIWDEEVFATKEVFTTGQVIGIVVADSAILARQAASMVKVEYEVLDAILSIEEAVAAESFIGDEGKIESGNVDEAMAKAEKQISGEVRIGGQEHFYLETQASLVVPGENNEFIVHTSSQNPTKTANYVAHVLGIPKAKVVCKVKRMGGGFGGKETRNVFISMACAVAAKKLNRSVRIMLDRDHDMCISGQRHPFLSKYKVGFNKDGLITAVDVKLYSNGGMSLDLSRPVLERAMFHIENAYSIPNVRVTGRVCRTNLPSNTAFRGFGGPQGMMACEAYMEHVARELGVHADEIRAKNLYPTRGGVTPYRQELVDCHLREMWAELQSSCDYTRRRAEVDEFNKKNKWKKRGISMMPVKFGMSFTAKFMNQASALVHVYTDGTVLVSHGGTEMGQGLHTKMCQIAASELGVSLDKVFVTETATDKCANTHPTAASVGADLNGFAVQDACKQIAARLERFRQAKPGATLAEIAMAAWLDRVDLTAHGFYKTPDIGYNFQTGEGRAFHYFAYGVACSEVEVDVLTGDFSTLRADILHDVGDSLNPAVDVGQVEGAFVQGMGLFTLEELVWMNNGQLFTRGPSTYKIPSANDIPIDMRVKLFENCPNRRTIYSSKGVGEPPLNLAISVFNAIREAVGAARRDAGKEGHFRMDTPASCERIRLAMGDFILGKYAASDVLAKGSW